MRIPLAPIDYLFARRGVPPIQFALEFDAVLDADALRRSLSVALQRFPLLTGSLVREGESELAIVATPDADPAERVLAVRGPVTGAGFADERSSLALVECAGDAPGSSLLRVTVRPCGEGTLVGASLAHVAGDGQSLALVLRAWACADAGEPIESPRLDRAPLRVPAARGASAPDAERIARDTTYRVGGDPVAAPARRTRDVTELDAHALRALREEACAERRGLSMHHVLTAHLLRRYHRYAPQEDPEHWVVRGPVGYRHLVPGLGARFFGNALRDAVTAIPRQGFDTMRLGDVASAVRAGIAAVDADAARRSLACFDALRRTRGLDAFRALVDSGLAVASFRHLGLETLRLGGHAPRRIVNLSDSFRTVNLMPTAHGVSVQFLRSVEPLA